MNLYRLSGTILLCVSAFAADTPKAQVVDSGSFGIMVNGRRVATEEFRMEQRENGNLVSSRLKMEDPALKAAQTAEMEIGVDGSLRRYTWKEVSPGKAQIVVTPDEAFLSLKMTDSDGTAPRDSMHPLSAMTPILDDNFFSHIEVLMWRYLAASCRPAAGGSECRYGEQKMPILNPHQQQSMVITVNYVGEQKMRYKGTEQAYRAFKFQTENGDWMLWVDTQNKLIRVLISAESTEVLRD